MANVRVEQDNTQEILNQLDAEVPKILEMIGMKAEKYAKALAPVGTVESTGIKGYRGGTLRNSITYEVDDDKLMVGSNVEYAPYVELGTGPNFTPPPSWETFETSKGSGVGHSYVRPRPFLRPAIEGHLSEYGEIIKSELSH